MSDKAAKWAWVVGLLVVVGACNVISGGGDESPTPTASAPQTAAAEWRSHFSAESTPEPESTGEVITVSRVVDGDTFELADGRKVRVLGIDSCEMKAPETYGGEQAKSWAEGLIGRYNTVTMTAEPGAPDTDRYGRLLRYVQVDGEDFGTEMVKWDHTGVYQGDNDASEAYVQQLYANDLEYASNPPSGRECADPYPTPASGGGVDIDLDDDHDRGLPDGALTGGYCARKWWC